MGSKNAIVSPWKCVCLAAAAAFVATVAPTAWSQTVVLPSSPAFAALPVALSVPRAAAAANSPEFSATSIMGPAYVKPVRQPSVREDHSRRNWLFLSAISSGAATFDAYTTRRAIGNGAIEMDPMMKPFANSNALYAAIQASPLVMDFAAYKMRRSENRVVRHMWWVPQSVGTAISVTAGVHNLGFAK